MTKPEDERWKFHPERMRQPMFWWLILLTVMLVTGIAAVVDWAIRAVP